MLNIFYILFPILSFLLFVFAIFSVQLIGPHQKGIITRKGRYLRFAEPKTMVLIIPFLDEIKKVSITDYTEYMKKFKEN